MSNTVIKIVDGNEEKEVKVNPKHHNVLIVNGKAKKVGKHSHYFLDMLTIEEE